MKRVNPISIYDTRFLEKPEGSKFVHLTAVGVGIPEYRMGNTNHLVDLLLPLDLKPLEGEPPAERYNILLSPQAADLLARDLQRTLEKYLRADEDTE